MKALNAAYGLEYHTPDWLVNTLAANLHLDRRQHVEELLLLRSQQPADGAPLAGNEIVRNPIEARYGCSTAHPQKTPAT